MKVSVMELLVVVIVALLVIGPNKLPQYAKKLGSALKELKKASGGISKEIKEEIIDPLQETQEPLRKIVEPFTELDKKVKEDINNVTQGFNDLGKPKTELKTNDTEEPASNQQPRVKSDAVGNKAVIETAGNIVETKVINEERKNEN